MSAEQLEELNNYAMKRVYPAFCDKILTRARQMDIGAENVNALHKFLLGKHQLRTEVKESLALFLFDELGNDEEEEEEEETEEDESEEEEKDAEDDVTNDGSDD